MVTQFRVDEYDLLQRALRCLEQDHREARDFADARARDPEYEFRKQALEASNFHAEQINKTSLLLGKVWRDASDAAKAA